MHGLTVVVELGRWYCSHCRTVWRMAVPPGSVPKHHCGSWMIPTSGSEDEYEGV